MLKRIKISKLFNRLDYDIILKPGGLTILTGPNGYGKTTILKMINALSEQDPFFFIKLRFEKIEVFFDTCADIVIGKVDGQLTMRAGARETNINYGENLREDFLSALRSNPLLTPVGKQNEFFDILSGKRLSYGEAIEKYSDTTLKGELDAIKSEFSYVVEDCSKALDSYIISEDRLLKQSYTGDGELGFVETIFESSRGLKNIISNELAMCLEFTQKLESSFPFRLFNEDGSISESEFNIRFEKLKNTQSLLSKYDLSVNVEGNKPNYKREDAKSLLVYLKDSEKKMKVFSNILEKLELFVKILTEKEFSFKKIQITKENGFKFISDKGERILLNDLSSGEKHEVILAYELLFKVKPGTFVLIDEPEMSLHVAWQKRFLDDFIRIAKIKKINVLIATHSPQIIVGRWDLTVDLWDLSNE